MKKILLFTLLMASIAIFGQNQPPVAVNDTVSYPVHLGDTITVNFLQNDYDPEGDSIFAFNIPYCISQTDSTASFYLSPILTSATGTYLYYNNGYIWYEYTVWNGYSLPVSTAKIVMYLDEPFFNFLDVNNVKARFNAFGNHFWDFGLGAGAQYYYPKDSTSTTIFMSSLWIGGMDETGNLHISAERYRQMGKDFLEGPLTTDGTALSDTANTLKWHKIWKLNLEDIEYHIAHWSDPGYEPIEEIATWPAHGDTVLGQSYFLAPFVDVNNNGDYEPLSGDYPLIRGDQSLFFVFNDVTDTAKRETKGIPIGIEIHGFAYAFSMPDKPALNNTTFLSYKIINRSQHTLTDTYAGVWTDIDLGYAWDDFVGCDVAGGYYYGYNSDSIDGGGEPEAFGENPPAQGVVILGGPYLDPDGEDNPAGGCDESINGVGFGDDIADNERYGMNRFVFMTNSGGVTGEPQINYEYYNYMKSIWKDSTAIEYGGNGHISSGAYGPAAKFMFPGLSDPCNWGTNGVPPNGALNWTEETTGNEPSDVRGLASMGPFTLEPGGVEKIDIAYVTAPGDSITNPIDRLKVYVDSIKAFYYEDPDNFGFINLGEEENIIANGNKIKVYPNPASSVLNIEIQETTECDYLTIYDIFGRLIKQTDVNGQKVIRVDISDLKRGVYFLKTNTKNATLTNKFIVR